MIPMLPICALLLAFLIDVLLGDPQGWPHPVRWIGNGALWLEPRFRNWFSGRPRVAGIACALAVDMIAAGAAGGLVWFAGWMHPWIGAGVAAVLVYFTIAAGDLAAHARRIHTALVRDGIEGGRKAVSMIVSRDTSVLDAKGVSRACVESVGENMTDGVLGALFWATIGAWAGGCVGLAAGAMFYRAANTLDSTFGFKTERYLHFGWCAARLDDVLNYIPARLTPLPVAIMAWIIGGSPREVLRIAWRDGRNHASPNSGYAEASMAAALQVQLGGPTYYPDGWRQYPTVGDPVRELEPDDILRAVFVMHVGSLLFLAAMAFILCFAR